MANNLNQNPITCDTTFVSWRASQTLNVGNLPTTLQQTSGVVPRQPGIQVYQMLWKAPGASASFTVTDPNNGLVRFNSITPAAFVGTDPFWFFQDPLKWRDFSVTISAGTLYIWYRS